MARKNEAPRRMVVGDETYVWSVRHDHSRRGEGDERHCRTLLTVRRPGGTGRLVLTFEAGPGRMVAEAFMPAGAVETADSPMVNLHEPGTARAFLDAALAGGWDPQGRTTLLVDGWPLLPGVAAERAGAAGPGLQDRP
ncbi:hypothetical protein [Kitasatospora sp. NPDC085879]|uniref:hypothetical protein n=1 Tax=Kitasatospora sp. NPDC085879 TaxID=3154769 RepID=UPI003431DB0E